MTQVVLHAALQLLNSKEGRALLKKAAQGSVEAARLIFKHSSDNSSKAPSQKDLDDIKTLAGMVDEQESADAAQESKATKDRADAIYNARKMSPGEMAARAGVEAITGGLKAYGAAKRIDADRLAAALMAATRQQTPEEAARWGFNNRAAQKKAQILYDQGKGARTQAITNQLAQSIDKVAREAFIREELARQAQAAAENPMPSAYYWTENSARRFADNRNKND